MNHLLASFILAFVVSTISLPVAAAGPEEQENGAVASRTATAVDVDASSKSPLELLPSEIQYKIFESLSPKDLDSVARASPALRKSVDDLREHCRKRHQHLVRAAMRAHESNPEEYGLPMFATPKSNIEKNIDSEMLKHLSPQQVQDIWAEFEIFAATPNSPIYAIADRIENYQKANMADVMLAAMYPEEAPSYLEKAAIHHLFSSYTVFHKEEGLTDWQQQVLPSKKEGLQQFIEKMYVEFEPGQVPAVRPDQKLVVKRGQLDTAANIAALNGIFRFGQPQPEMVLDFDGEEQLAALYSEDLPAQLTNLAIINSGGAVTAIGGHFLAFNESLKTVTLSLPQLKQVGDWFLSDSQSLQDLTLNLPQLTQVGNLFLSNNNQSLKTVTLSLPQLTQVGDHFLSRNQRFKTLTLSLPQLTQVGDRFLFECEKLKSVDLRSLLKLEKVEADCFMKHMTKLEQVLIDARQKEFFKDLLKNRSDLLPKFKVA
jgi:hypothetical protein